MYIRGLIPRNWPRQFRLGCAYDWLSGCGIVRVSLNIQIWPYILFFFNSIVSLLDILFKFRISILDLFCCSSLSTLRPKCILQTVYGPKSDGSLKSCLTRFFYCFHDECCLLHLILLKNETKADNILKTKILTV